MSPRFSFSEVFLRTQSDACLCGLAGDGQPLAFAMLVERHHAALIRTAARVGGTQRAEDAVQEALLRAWVALRSGTQVEHIPSWLHQIVRNSTLNQIARERGPTEPLPDELADPQRLGAALEARLLARDLLAQIAALPERQRTALVQTELGGRSRREIAADLGLSEGGVRQLVYRARSAVRVAMTAITPYPLAAWVARRSAGHGEVDRLVGMLPPTSSGRSGLLETLTAGGAGGGALLKGGAVLIAAGALGGGVAWHQLAVAPAHHRTVAPAHHRTVASARPAKAARRSPVATVAAVAPVGVAEAWHPALTAFRGTTITSSPRTSQSDRSKQSSPSSETVHRAGSDGNHQLADATPTSRAGSETTPVSSGSTGASDTSSPSKTNTTAGSGDSGSTSSGSGSDSGSGSPSGSAGSGSVDSSGSSTPDATAATSTTASGGD